MFVKVLVPIGFGTEEMDVVIMTDILRRAGVHVTMVSVARNLQIHCFNIALFTSNNGENRINCKVLTLSHVSLQVATK